MNIIFEILYLLSVFYLLALYFSLFRNVVSHRRETKTSLGHKGEKLERVIRAHSNFCETVPFNLFLSLILYFNNYHFICFLSLLIMCVGRRVHASSISNMDEDLNKRRLGMRLTVISYLILIIGMLYYIGSIIYFYILSQTYSTTILP
jgi:uncharacterized membrane protein YecN with MAPEG domain